MKKEIPVIDYVTKDYEGFRQLMIDTIPQIAPEWTDTSQSDFGVVLIELLSQGLDVLSYYLDKAVNENIISTAQRRDSMIFLSNFLGYAIPEQTPSKFMVKFVKHSDLVNKEIIVPVGTKLNTEDDYIFETEETLIIPEGILEKEVSVIHGETIENDIIGESTGDEDQLFSLSNINIMKNTILLYTRNNDGSILAWDKVDNFLDSKTTDRHYIAKEDGEATLIQFSNGRSGAIPSRSSKIIAQYRVGGGEAGNVGIRTINDFYENSIDGIDFFHNEKPAYIKGKDTEDIETTRVKAPKYHRTNQRAVTRYDFEDLALMIDGVKKSKLQETFDYRDIVYLYLIDDNYSVAEKPLQDKVRENIERVMLIKTRLEFKDPIIKEFDIKVHIKVKDGYVREQVMQELKETYEETYSLDYMDFGESIKTFSLIYIAGKHLGIEDAEVIESVDIEVGEFEILKLNHVTITGSGGVLLEETAQPVI